MQIPKFRWSCLLFFLFANSLLAQTEATKEKFWIFLTDKGDVSQVSPGDILTPRALERRARHGIAVQMNDYPVNREYIAALGALGAELRQSSRWFNGVSAWMDATTTAEVRKLPFVREVKAIPKVTLDMDALDPNVARYGYNSGFTSQQLDMIGLDQLHQNGYNGRGVLISVMDNGFRNIDQNPYLKHLFTGDRILATHDFVNDEADVMNQGSHGAAVLTILAGWGEDVNDPEFNYYGSAHGATYILCHTEDDASETHQEEDNWVAAMEYADSLGADIISTSLGYRDFDNNDDYGYQGMDGNTAIITIGADLAASKGIVVVNSAGNSGANKIMAPADGDSVIAVGAVDAEREIAGFSSHGPSFDNRVKPDVCAMGRATAYVNSAGQLTRGNGTSFSCPVLSGFLACLLQAAPQTRNMDLYQALIRSADRYESPDEFYGYGIPSAERAYLQLTGEKLRSAVPNALVEENALVIYPNPATKEFHLIIDNDATGTDAVMEVVDMRGKLVLQKDMRIEPFFNVIRIQRDRDYPGLAAGRYALRVRSSDSDQLIYTGRLAILTDR